jgi:apolipoprotein N-acyltransferase
LVNVSNDAWFGHSIAPQQHLQIARMRAVETGRPLLRATNTGVTAIVDAKGRLQAVAPQFEVAALSGEVQPMQGATPYVRLGNSLVVVLMAGMLVIPWWLMRRRALR